MIAPLPKPLPAFTILIADDHWVVRESLKQVARGIDASIDIKEAATFEEALTILDHDPYISLILVDLVMPGVKDFKGLELLRRRFPSVPVAVVSIHEDPDYVRQAIQNGVIGYIPKSADAEEIRRALTRIFGGEVYFPRELLTRSWPVATEHAPQPDRTDGPRLSRREDEIIGLLGKGRAIPDISEMLGITAQTVRVHLGNAMRKLGLKSREAAILFAVNRSAKNDGR
ncbi:MAG: response regulator transcription factor [Proteobacteria bacterium]|nr:response regulator transcription factor [Pseudomonadota bacterium]